MRNYRETVVKYDDDDWGMTAADAYGCDEDLTGASLDHWLEGNGY